jgi:phosphoglycolate phosphatase
MIHGIFFDLDGTLFDTKPDILAAYRSVFQSNGIPFDPEKLRIGPPLTECLRQFMPEITPEETARMVADFREFYDHSDFAGTIPYPGIPEALAALHAAGYKLFVATNKRLTPTLKILELKGIMPYFTDVYACDSDPDKRRTKAEYLQIAMQKYDLAPENCLMVGDTRLDVEAGHGAALRVVGVDWGYDSREELASAGPERIISRAEELVNLAETL